MTLNKWYLGGLVVVGLLSIVAVTRPPTVEKIVETLSSASSPSVVNGCMEINGATVCHQGQSMRNASTTCAFKSPTATSSLAFAGATFRNTYTGSFDVEWGKSTSAYATTTTLGYKPAAIASGDTGTFVATSTISVASTADIEDESHIIAPNSYVNLKVGSSSPTLSGSCAVEFLVI